MMLEHFDDPWVLAHLTVAIRKHRESLRQTTHSCPPGLAELETFSSSRLRAVQSGSSLVGEVAMLHDRGMNQPLLLDFDQARKALAVSVSTVKRLVTNGELPAVKVGGRTLIRRSDLERYVTDLKGANDGHDHRAA